MRIPRTAARLGLGAFLVLAGSMHFKDGSRQAYAKMVPDWVPGSKDGVVLASGAAEIAQGAALIALPRHQRALGNLIAAFFVGVTAANVHQYRERSSAFGLDTDRKRTVRLAVQPAFVAWALAATRGSR
ncbi:hypothetical protein [Janibacter sp. GXQ6167]|uniref:DoxX family protein n=1 Tax=Janibacter sp. GXQ6167 TaxID=3240791 RepID=UPI0035236A9E